jgi:hypothetical protein
MLPLTRSVKPRAVSRDALKHHSRLSAPCRQEALRLSIKRNQEVLHHSGEERLDGSLKVAHPAVIAVGAGAFHLPATVAPSRAPLDATRAYLRSPQFGVGIPEFFVNPFGKPVFGSRRPAAAEDAEPPHLVRRVALRFAASLLSLPSTSKLPHGFLYVFLRGSKDPLRCVHEALPRRGLTPFHVWRLSWGHAPPT